MYSRLYVYADSVLDAGGVADWRTNTTYSTLGSLYGGLNFSTLYPFLFRPLPSLKKLVPGPRV